MSSHKTLPKTTFRQRFLHVALTSVARDNKRAVLADFLDCEDSVSITVSSLNFVIIEI